jgi:hypothetical protein
VTLVWLALLAPVSAQTVSDAIEKGRTVFFSRGCSGRHRLGAAGTPIAHDFSHVGSRFTEGDLASLVARSDKPEAHGTYAAPGAVLRPGQVAPDASRNPLTGVLSCSRAIGGSRRWRVFATPRGEWRLSGMAVSPSCVCGCLPVAGAGVAFRVGRDSSSWGARCSRLHGWSCSRSNLPPEK